MGGVRLGFLFLVVTFLSGNAAMGCVGDCDADRSVTIAELVACVGIASAQQPVAVCVGCDGDADGRVDVPELITGISHALAGCDTRRREGSRCEVAAQCESSFCISGICCNTACEVGRCDLPDRIGECTALLPPGSICGRDEECASGVCDEGGVCCSRECPVPCRDDGSCVLNSSR